ncbi:oxygen-independent coproporphyrinogen III oxidase [Alteromonas sp. D210916BOD_24]|uniref:oxygen-independent coproporphyrinogen III oxidase n=1 Tax=Alteromonas sp. D210916BOD_24 TaxID=3157618 RepID=UPI00399CCBE3
MMTTTERSNQALSRVIKYAQHAPRYTSYPTALKFAPVNDDILQIANRNTTTNRVNLYVHIPFCNTLCYYCGCNKIVTRHPHKADEYLTYLDKELTAKAELLIGKRFVSLHLGGGSPSFLSEKQHIALMDILSKHVKFDSHAELSIELDPRNVDKGYLQNLRSLGYTRLSFGLQDTDYQVQKMINRVQSTAHIADLMFEARTLGFTSINLDLIYGLPSQTLDTFKTTLAATKAMQPDRISLFSYAHLPDRFAAQRKFADETLPNASLKAQLYDYAVSTLTKVGYEMIGLDHFAKANDTLAIAKHNEKLHRNFQGYTTQADSDLIGIGVSSISTIGNAFAQNPKDLNAYYARIDALQPAASIGLQLTRDDLIRRDVIASLMCNLKVDKRVIEARYALIFDDYFEQALANLTHIAEDGLVILKEDEIRIPEHGRIFSRAICARFDAYLNTEEKLGCYSKAI